MEMAEGFLFGQDSDVITLRVSHQFVDFLRGERGAVGSDQRLIGEIVDVSMYSPNMLIL